MADDKYANAKWRFLLRNENQRIWHSKLSGSTPAAAYTASGKIFAAGGYQTGVGKRHLVLGKTGYSHRTKPDLQDKRSDIQSCKDINRELIEEYLIHKATNGSSGKSNGDDILKLRNVLESIGKLFGYANLEGLFINTNIT